MKTLAIIDSGHGGINKNGVYETSPNFNKKDPSTWLKCWHFEDSDITIFEGDVNRKIAGFLIEELEAIGVESFNLTTGSRDIPLPERVFKANEVDKLTNDDCIYISIHCNAAGVRNASGWEIFTSKGQTGSDKVATSIGERFKLDFPELRMRFDYSDGDLDKEAGFFVLRKTSMKAVLIEYGFMTNKEGCVKLLNPDYQRSLAKATALGIKDYLSAK